MWVICSDRSCASSLGTCKVKRDESKNESEAYTVDWALVEALAQVGSIYVGLHLNLAAVRAHDERQVLTPFRGMN